MRRLRYEWRKRGCKLLTKREAAALVLPKDKKPLKERGEAFAPANIALVKYWGKCDDELNTPRTASLSVTLDGLGAKTVIRRGHSSDRIWLNGVELGADSGFSGRLSSYLDIYRDDQCRFFEVETESNIPIGAGLASSAAGFAALALALDDLFGWELEPSALSILARLGSGSACRSLYPGFVEWRTGRCGDGSDSHSVPLKERMPGLRVGLVMVDEAEKPVGSREAMRRTRDTSPLYEAWPRQVAHDLRSMKRAIKHRDFELLGETAEANALAMHATMMAARPAVLYWLPASVAQMRRVWELRARGVPLFFTMDAGPNLKLLFMAETEALVREAFPELRVVDIFP